MAMWKLYDPSGYGIAMVSSFDRLRDSLEACEESVFVGSVTYIDYNTEQKWLGNLLDPVMHKHKAFIHEREIRAVVWHKTWTAYWKRVNEEVARKHGYKTEPVIFEPRAGGDRNVNAGTGCQIGDSAESTTEPPTGIKLPCDLSRLVDYIVVSPTCQQWMVELVREYCHDAIDKEVRDSELKAGPFF